MLALVLNGVPSVHPTVSCERRLGARAPREGGRWPWGWRRHGTLRTTPLHDRAPVGETLRVKEAKPTSGKHESGIQDLAGER